MQSFKSIDLLTERAGIVQAKVYAGERPVEAGQDVIIDGEVFHVQHVLPMAQPVVPGKTQLRLTLRALTRSRRDPEPVPGRSHPRPRRRVERSRNKSAA